MAILPSLKVILFDIDGTLIYAHPIHIKVYQQSLSQVAHVSVPDSKKETISKHFGKMEKDVFRGILSTYGIHHPSNRLLTQLVKANERNFVKAKKFISAKNVLPGVKVLLARLQRRGCILGVVSGNTRVKGEALLRYTGLFDFFSITSFSNDSWKGKKPSTRHEIVENALRKAMRLKKNVLRGEMAVVGDTPSDIEAGKKAGVFTIGVGTGHFSATQLKKCHPDIVLKTLAGVKLE